MVLCGARLRMCVVDTVQRGVSGCFWLSAGPNHSAHRNSAMAPAKKAVNSTKVSQLPSLFPLLLASADPHEPCFQQPKAPARQATQSEARASEEIEEVSSAGQSRFRDSSPSMLPLQDSESSITPTDDLVLKRNVPNKNGKRPLISQPIDPVGPSMPSSSLL